MPIRRYVFLLGALAAPVIHAATEFENGLVPIDLLRQIVGGNVYRSLPDGFPVVTLPAGIDVHLLGSIQRGSSRDAVLSTTQDPAAVRAALMAAYVAAGWLDVSGTNAALMSRLCHDQLGMLTIIPASSNFNGLRVTHSAGFFSSSQNCASLAQGGTSQWTTYFLALMPTLTPPPQTLPPGNAGSFGTSLSSSFINATSYVRLERESGLEVPDINIAGMYAHFAARLVEQGWVNDSEDSGLKSAVSAWYRSVPPPENVEASDTELTGYFTIVHTGDDTYRLSFALEATTDANVSLGSFYSVSFDSFGPPLSSPTLGIRGIPSGYVVP